MRKLRASRGAVLAMAGAAVLIAGAAAPAAAQQTGPGVVGFGYNFYGELGNGSTVQSDSPVQVSDLPVNVSEVAAYLGTSAALLPDGTVWVWGYNPGTLGDGTSCHCAVTAPQRVPGLTGVVQIAVSDGDVFAVRSDGTVWGWGDNSDGQLGDGTTTAHYSPERVPGLTGITQVATSGADWFTLARRSDGTVWAWGDNTYGELGDGTTTAHHSPERVPGLTGITQVSIGLTAGFAVRSDGTVFSWGSELYGVLGNGVNGTSEFTTAPAPVPGLTGITQVAAAGFHVLALAGSGGTVWAWGDNDLGDLGDGGDTPRSTPERIPLSGVTQLSAGAWSSAAVRSDGTLLTWGDDSSGQLGNGTCCTAVNAVPVQVPGLTGVSQVADGAIYDLAIVRPATVPNVAGTTPSLASAALRAAGLVLGTVSYVADYTCNHIGRVTHQSPAAGYVVSAGSAVAVTVGARPPTPCP